MYSFNEEIGTGRLYQSEKKLKIVSNQDQTKYEP